ncbi:MAG TPA: VOC family protein [Desulfobulbus sp.]|nr:VOC family protein [Desulfobulbus sp.]
MQIDSLDHLVLTVGDIETTCRFYTRVLGMRVVEFGSGRRALAFGSQKINLHRLHDTIEPCAAVPLPGSADLCLLTSTPMTEILDHLRANDIRPVAGPVERTGARGPILSVYLRDPDGNLLEIANPISHSSREEHHAA